MTSSGTDRQDKPVLRVRNLSMSFGATNALVDVDLDLYEGEVLGLIGTNGAGKSTLIKVISGVHQPTGGHIELDGREVDFATPIDAAQTGIQTVHQQIDEGIVRGMTAAENLVLDAYADGTMPWFVGPRATKARAAAVADAMSLQVDLDAPVESLSPSDRQQLIIARALSRGPRVLILDEPTSTFSTVEARRLYEVVRLLAKRNVSIVFISHDMGEIESLCNRVVVLRDGRVRGAFTAPLGRSQLVATMLGELRSLAADTVQEAQADGDVVFSANDVTARPDTAGISFQIHRGEVVGLTGLIAAGKTELLEQIFGARPLLHGKLTLNGRPFAPRSPAEAVAAGVAFVPEDRATLALIPRWTVTRNITLPFLHSYSQWSLMHPKSERNVAKRFIEEMEIRCSGPEATIGSLSGGNQQKVVVARWLQSDSALVILDEPFRGIDIGARHEIIRHLRQQGDRAVIVASSDPEEILEVADRILVLAGGALVGELSVEEANTSRLAALMAGG